MWVCLVIYDDDVVDVMIQQFLQVMLFLDCIVVCVIQEYVDVVGVECIFSVYEDWDYEVIFEVVCEKVYCVGLIGEQVVGYCVGGE